ncbi:MAG: hypothetical protein H7228_05600 [Polaromonas sp.]|nr:hypothetical protein [Polaromonas sp.]
MHPAPLSLVTKMKEQHANEQHAGLSTPYPSAPMWRGTSLATNAGGQEEAFSIGLDGYIWSYAIRSDSGRTGRLISTGLRAETFATGRAHDGRSLVIAADGACVHYVIETGNPDQRWSLPCPATFSAGHADVAAIDKIFTQTLCGHLFVGVLTRHSGSHGEDLYQFWESIWSAKGLVFSHSPLKIEHENNIWLDKIAGSLCEMA